MELTQTIKHSICSLFDVCADGNGVYRVVTPLEYPGTNDQIVIRVRVRDDRFEIDENGEAALFSSMSDGDVESEAVARWLSDLEGMSTVSYSDEEVLYASTHDERMIPALIFRVAEAAQHLFALSTARQPRRLSAFKEQVADAVRAAADSIGFEYKSDVELPIAGDFVADHVISSPTPLIVIAATGIQRLLEAEIIHMRYLQEKKPAFVLAAVESQKSVGMKQFERANYYTGKTVSFNPTDFSALIASRLQ